MEKQRQQEKTDAVVTSKGQLVIPVALRRRYKIGRGTRVRFEDTRRGILIRPVTDEYIDALRGVLAHEQMPAKIDRDPDRELQ